MALGKTRYELLPCAYPSPCVLIVFVPIFIHLHCQYVVPLLVISNLFFLSFFFLIRSLVISNPITGYLLQFYIDPKTGYVFRSKKDVLRYLETGKISRHAFKPKEGGDNDQELITNKISVSPSLVRLM